MSTSKGRETEIYSVRSGAALYEMRIYQELAEDSSGEVEVQPTAGCSVSLERRYCSQISCTARNSCLTHVELFIKLQTMPHLQVSTPAKPLRISGQTQAILTRSKCLEQLRQAHQTAGELRESAVHDMVSSQQGRRSVETKLERRRQARRLRRHQADMAAAVAGAIVGVRA